MVLRELTEAEKDELNRFVMRTEENGHQVLLAMIAVDLMQEKAYEHPLCYSEFKEYITKTNMYSDDDLFILDPLINTWLEKLIVNNQISININDKVKKYNHYLTYNYMDTVCRISGGMTGKKQMEMLKLYNEINELKYEEKGKELDDLPEETYQYIVTCLEYMGFKRKPNTGVQVVDISGITNNDLFFDGSI